MRQPIKRLIFFLGVGLAALMLGQLAACGRLPTPTLPPTFVIPSPEALTATLTPTVTPSPSSSPSPTSTETETVAAEITVELDVTATATPTPAGFEETRAVEVALQQAQTQYALLQTPSATPTPCKGRCPTPTYGPLGRPTATGTSTPVPTPPQAYLRINYPGPLSKVVSPIHLDANVHTGSGGTMRIDLLGEDGRLIYRQIVRFTADAGVPVHLNLDIKYEIQAVAEAARLQISIDDDQRRVMSLTSVNLVLLSIGDSEINPGVDSVRPFIIESPSEYDAIMKGVVVVTGLARPVVDSPLILELYDGDGVVLGRRQVSVPLKADGTHSPFTAEVQYSITQPVVARLVIRQQTSRIPGNVELYSLILLLRP